MKKLLIVTQTVDSNDPILGFFVGWIREFGKQCEEVHVLALNVGTYELPANVTVHCLGKSEGRPKPVWLWRLWRLSITLRHRYDDVFVHMNPEYVILGALTWYMLHKKILLWYAHGAVTNKLWCANLLAYKVFSSTSNGFKLSSKKVNFVGQGINTEIFNPLKKELTLPPKFVTWGRVSRSKGFETLIKAFANVQKKYPEATFTSIGNTLTKEDESYMLELTDLIKTLSLDNVSFLPGLPPEKLASQLSEYSHFIQNGKTGSLDKAILEAICSGLVTISSNKAFKEFIGPQKSELYSYIEDSSEDLTSKIFTILERYNTVEADLSEIRQEVIKNHSIQGLIKKILTV